MPCAGLEPVPGYRLVKRLGKGGFGEVWEAQQLNSGFRVAFKYVSLAAKAGSLEQRALEIIREIRHPNLLVIFGTWQIEGWLIIGMELADRTLLDRFEEVVAQKLAGIPRRELLRYSREAAEVLDYLNKPRHFFGGTKPVGIQHGDIKPQNILLVGQGVKVGDFGLMRLLEKSIVGHEGGLTPSYAAPEVLAGHISRWSDQYSLAVTYCKLRGGRLPFPDGKDRGELDLTMLPEEERPAVERALAPRPQGRWPNCRAFLKALVEAKKRPISDLETSAPDREAEAAEVALSGAVESCASVGAPVDLEKQPPPSTVPQEQPPPPPTASYDPSMWERRRPRSEEDDYEEERHYRRRRRAAPDFPFAPRKRIRLLTGFLVFLVSAGLGGLAMFVAICIGRGVPSAVETLIFVVPALVSLLLVMIVKLFVRRGKPRDASTGPERPTVVPSVPRLPGTEVMACKSSKLDGSPYIDHPAPLPAMACGPKSPVPAMGELPPSPGAAPSLSSQPRLLEGHTDAVWSVVFSPDSRLVLSGSMDSTLRLWQAESGCEVRCLEGHADGVTGVSFTPDGRKVLSSSLDGTVRLWEIETGRELARFEGHIGRILCLAVLPDGRRFLSGGEDRTIHLWDLENRQGLRRFEGHKGWVTSVAVSGDGPLLLSGSEDMTVRLWNVESGRELRRFAKHTGPVKCVALSSDGKWAFSGGEDRTVRLWKINTGTPPARFRDHADWVRCLACSPDGRVVLSGSDDETLRWWRLDKRHEKPTELQCVAELACSFLSVALSPDGRRVAAGTDANVIYFWELRR
jgi:serine/threonine protein kinase